MNKNTSRRQRQIKIAAKASGGFPKPAFKAKAKPFPSVGEPMTLMAQKKFLGYSV